MILVTGATGPFGSAAIQFLIKQGIDPKMIAGLARDENKAARLNMLQRSAGRKVLGNTILKPTDLIWK